jgi:hypothetical protein
MNSKILFFAALFIAILSTPMAAQAITASANLSIFIGEPGRPDHEDRLTFDAQASFNPPTQINQNTPVAVSIMKTGQASTPYTSQLNADCTSDCILGDYYFTSGNQVGVTYSDNTTLAITDYGTHTLHLLINEVPAFHGQVHHTDYGSTPATFTVNQPPPSYQCSDNNDNDNDGLEDADDPRCHTNCTISNPADPANSISYIYNFDSESSPACPAPSGNIYAAGQSNAYQCTISINGSNCSPVNISWNTTNATTPVVEINGSPFDSGGASGSQSAPWINPNSSPYQFNLRNNNVSGTVLDTVTVTAVCASGSTWNGSICEADPPTTYSCTGAVPSNADLCSDDNTGLSANTPITMVDSCVPNSIKCEYTCDVGYELSGGVCVVSASPSASINAPDCSIAAGSNSCISSVSWSTSNISSPSIRQNGTQFSTLTSSGGTSRILLRGTYTFTVYDGATERASDIAIAECEIGTIWNGSVCEINSVPSASIDAPDCTIIAGESGCTSSVSWNTQYISSPSVRQNNIPFSSSLSSPGTDRPLTRGTHIFTVYDGATLEASDAAIAECAPSAPWNGTICDGVPPPPPVVTLSASPTSITAGNSSTLTWTVTGTADSCFASNTNGYVDWSGWKSYNPTNNQSVSPALTTTYSITCYNEGVESNTATAVVTVAGALVTPNIGWTAAPIFDPQNKTVELTQGQSTTNQTLYVTTGSAANCALTGIFSGTTPARVEPVTETSYAINVGLGNFIYSLACSDGTFKSANLNVNPYSGPSDPKLIICPAANPISIMEGYTRQLDAWHRSDYDGTQDCSDSGWTDVTDSAIWSSEDDYIATVDNATNKGLVSGLKL